QAGQAKRKLTDETGHTERKLADETGQAERNEADKASQQERKLADEAGQAERLLAEQLLGGEDASEDAHAEAVRRLPPRWEIRIQTEYDPVVEETRKYRSMAEEVDDRYDVRDRKRGSSPDAPKSTETGSE